MLQTSTAERIERWEGNGREINALLVDSKLCDGRL